MHLNHTSSRNYTDTLATKSMAKRFPTILFFKKCTPFDSKLIDEVGFLKNNLHNKLKKELQFIQRKYISKFR